MIKHIEKNINEDDLESSEKSLLYYKQIRRGCAIGFSSGIILIIIAEGFLMSKAFKLVKKVKENK